MQVDLSKVGLEGCIPLTDRSDHCVQLAGVEELVSVGLLLVLVLVAATETDSGGTRAGALTAELVNDTVVGVTK